MRHPSRHTGFSLVELMVAMTIGLIIIVAVSALFLSNQRTSRTQQAHSVMQDNARVALDRLTYTIRHAGYAGYFGGENRSASATDAPGSLSMGVFGDATQDSNAVVNVAPGRSFLNASQVLTGIHNQPISGITAVGVTGLDAIEDTQSDQITISYQVGTLREASATLANQNSGTTGPLDCLGRVPYIVMPATDTAQNTQPETTVTNHFYIGVTKDVSGKFQPALMCDATYTSKRGTGVDGTETGVVASNVERMQILYGMDTDNDGRPNRFVPAGTGTLDMKQVVAIRIALLMRDKSADTRQAAEPAAYNMFGPQYAAVAGNESGTTVSPLGTAGNACTASAPCWNRRVFETTLYLRNGSPASR